MAGDLILLQMAAALCEEIYRRATEDQQLTDNNLQVKAVDVSANLQGTGLVPTGDGWYYDNSTGFVGRVVSDGNTTYVVIRGTDFSGGFPDLAQDVTANYFPSLGLTPTGKVDLNDFFLGNQPLGIGTTGKTQLNDALALAQAAQASAGQQPIVVTGQSLGGGLAGLVAAMTGLKGVLIAPAPFANQLVIAAQQIAAQQEQLTDLPDAFFGVSIQSSLVRAAFFANMSAVDPDLAFRFGNDFSAAMDTFNARINDNVTVAELTGQALTSGLIGVVTPVLGAILSAIESGSPLGASIPTQLKAPDSPFDLGASAGLTTNETVALHSPSLTNLVIRTETLPDEQFSALMRGDSDLRTSLLDNAGIAGPVEHQRADPVDPITGATSSSAMESGGPNDNVLYNALWKTVGQDGGFYDQFYARFGTWLSTGAAGQGKSPTRTSNLSLHSGLVKLGLQVVRDTILDPSGNNPILGAKLPELFGNGNQFGPSAGYVRINLADIQPSSDLQLEQTSSGNTEYFGLRDINEFIEKQAMATLGPDVGAGESSDVKYINSVMGATLQEIDSGQKVPGIDWSTLIVQSGGPAPDGTPGSFSYDAQAVDASGEQSVGAYTSNVVIGGAGNNAMKGSSADDYLVGSSGDNTFESGGGHDVIIGGSSNNTYVARSGPTETDSVTFFGNGSKNLADYSKVSTPLDRSIRMIRM